MKNAIKLFWPWMLGIIGLITAIFYDLHGPVRTNPFFWVFVLGSVGQVVRFLVYYFRNKSNNGNHQSDH